MFSGYDISNTFALQTFFPLRLFETMDYKKF
jgi:hypothetical protein